MGEGGTPITMEVLQHPADRKALAALKKVKGLDFLTRKAIEWGIEGRIRKELLANCLRVGERQCPSLHELYVDCASSLGVEEPPELFVECNPYPVSYIVGVSKAMIVLSTGLVDVMEEDEVRFALGHELGHFLCQHVLYQTMVRYISEIVARLGDVISVAGPLGGMTKVAVKPIEVALLSWSRVSEFSADRAGLIACRDLDTALSALVKLGIPSRKLWGEVDVGELVRQAEELELEIEEGVEEFEEPSEPEGKLAKVRKGLAKVKEKVKGLAGKWSRASIGTRTQPWPILRVRELVMWAGSEEYEGLLRWARGQSS
ncbi:hypothetical protein DRO32_03220 [Candidatus Bathyarchaeota archaeon]|nr:MAG: hypothetical protein DRO32_03220 [Candidatus Bathyarchaeota archaeon]